MFLSPRQTLRLLLPPILSRCRQMFRMILLRFVSSSLTFCHWHVEAFSRKLCYPVSGVRHPAQFQFLVLLQTLRGQWMGGMTSRQPSPSLSCIRGSNGMGSTMGGVTWLAMTSPWAALAHGFISNFKLNVMKTCLWYVSLFFPFFFLHCRASTGHGRSTLEECESKKKGETGITCRSHFTGKVSKTKPRPNKQTTTTKQTHRKKSRWKSSQKGWNLRAPQTLISSLAPCSASSMPSMWMIRCPSCPLLLLPAQAGLSHQVRVVAVWAGMCPLLFATALHSNPCMYQSRHEHSHPCPGMHVWSHWCPGPAAHVGVCSTTSTVDFAPTSPGLLYGLVHGMLSLHRDFSGCPWRLC